jgi:signal transduction histidine kinase/DNA-binding response OmpR family regulator
MGTSLSAAPSDGAPQVQETLRELQDQTVGYVFPALYGLGLLLILGAGLIYPLFHGALFGLGLLTVVGVAWVLYRRSYLAAVITLLVGCFAAIGLLLFWLHVAASVVLVALPVGLTLLLINKRTGVVVAALCSLFLLFAPQTWVAVEPALRLIAVLHLWGMVGLLWLTSHSLLTAMLWFRTTYERSQLLLEQARDHRAEISQMVDDLAMANLQLARLHRLAHAMREVAEEARRTKEKLLANVSHELRTPLNMIIGFTELIVKTPQAYGQQLPQALLADLSVVLRNSQHLSTLIDDVLDLSQVEVGQMALAKEWTHLDETIRMAVLAVQPLYASKQLTLQTALAVDLPPVYCDPVRIRQVLLNLLSNAGRFTERGGVLIRAQVTGRMMQVSVTDSGPGIATADLVRIFQPFQQADTSLRKRHGGSGLGLSISRSFIELHGGKIWAESQVNCGATFHFQLPISDPQNQSVDVPHWLPPHDQYVERTRPFRAPLVEVRPRMVVLEHGQTLQRLLTRYLAPVELIAVDSWEAARAALAQTPSQLLLVNETSVGLTLQQLEAERLPYNTPLIVCSVPGAQDYALALGASDYLVKPVGSEQLLAALAPFRQRKVLLVDDDPDLLRLFRRILAGSAHEYQVLRAQSGAQALQIMRQEQPSVVLLDLLMPDMDGFQLLAQKSLDPAIQAIPVIVVSAQNPSGQPVVSQTLAVRHSDGLTPHQLVRAIAGLLQLFSPQAVDLGVDRDRELGS